MKKPLLILSLLVLVFLIWREFQTAAPTEPTVAEAPPIEVPEAPPFPTQPAAPKPAPPAAKVHTEKPEPAPQLGKTFTATKSTDGKRQKPPPNAVPFELKDGLVISFGDVLLGRPTVEDFPDAGFIDAPKIKYWSGEIAYSFDPGLPDPERVQKVIAYFNQNTPVRFVPYTDQQDSIVFSPSQTGLCLSYVGKIGGHQPIYLDDRCFEKEITHELMHALGFIHEHSRPDRDQFVRVNWDKIEEDKQSQFEAAPFSMAQPHKGRPFDYQSVTIYDPTDFAIERGELTIESLTGAKIEPTPAGISAEDLARLVLLYGQ